MKAFRLRVLSLMGGLLLASCASAPPQRLTPPLADDEALLAPKARFVVPPPAAMAETVNVAQTIVARFRDTSYAFDAQLQISPDELDLVALDGLGRRALTVTWKDGKIQSTAAPWLPSFVRPADILADIVIVYGPEQVVSSSAESAGAALTVTDGQRMIAVGSRKVVVVRYGAGEDWNRSAKLHNFAFDYDIAIQSTAMSR
jgi:Protein of unknown function (DUF3261)